MAYATVAEVCSGFRELSEAEKASVKDLLEEAELIIDSFCGSEHASGRAKARVSVRMVRRAIGDGEGSAFPVGATQGSVSALGYTQSWTLGSSGTTGELYLNKMDKKLLGLGRRLAFVSALEREAPDD